MRLIPELAVDNGSVLTGIGGPLVHGVANVNPVIQEPIEHTLIEQVSVAVGSAGRDQLLGQQRRRLQLHEPPKYRPDPLSVSVMNDELAIPDLIAEGSPAAHPHALLAGCSDLVADTLANIRPKAQQSSDGAGGQISGSICLRTALRRNDELIAGSENRRPSTFLALPSSVNATVVGSSLSNHHGAIACRHRSGGSRRNCDGVCTSLSPSKGPGSSRWSEASSPIMPCRLTVLHWEHSTTMCSASG